MSTDLQQTGQQTALGVVTELELKGYAGYGEENDAVKGGEEGEVDEDWDDVDESINS